MRSTGRHEGDDSAPSVLARATAILSAFDRDRRPLGISELARRTGLAKSTVHRLTAELTRHGLLERRSEGLVLGLRLFELGELVPRQLDLREAALPYMADLRAATRQTVHLAVLDGTEVVYVEILRHHDAPPLPSRVGGRLPAHATAVGKAILAFSDPDVTEAVLRAGLRRLAERTITNPDLLRRTLKFTRAHGIAYDYEESQAGLVCAASPITTATGDVAGALSVSGWAGRLNVRRLGPAVRTAALTLSRDLASSGP
ncbi:MAG: IclR family transcriptional regulator [Mycobacterium sp.]|uniref:IclR family transcriptional regulator n=1 Tax=Mycobacterium sp. TaxID=1785 RepID=UPI0026084A0D|nr:IclR family transcriptional regulator [Mycobacterium sp.]MDI3313816.1 IclR family transcriptional regulator [Mycobacterium sp.]